MNKNWFSSENENHLKFLRKGIEQRLENPEFYQLASLIWAKLADTLKIKRVEIGLPEAINESEIFSEPKMISPIEKNSEKINTKPPEKEEKLENKNSKEIPKKTLEYAENDSDNESDFEPYEIHDNCEDLQKITPPKFLYDCLLGLDSENPQRYQYSLEFCENIIRQNPMDLNIYSKELCQKLMRADNKFNFENFFSYISKSLSALLVFSTEISFMYFFLKYYNEFIGKLFRDFILMKLH